MSVAAKRMLPRERTVSDHGLQFIGRFEGFVDHAYKPVAGERYWTIGYGHYGPDVKLGQRISRTKALELLRRDARHAVVAVKRSVHVPLTRNEFDALVSLCFNIGSGAFASSTVVRELNKGHRRRAAAAFLLWVRGANGQRLAGLVRRRQAEARLFLRRR